MVAQEVVEFALDSQQAIARLVNGIEHFFKLFSVDVFFHCFLI
jgi:hypothetical protein